MGRHSITQPRPPKVAQHRTHWTSIPTAEPTTRLCYSAITAASCRPARIPTTLNRHRRAPAGACGWNSGIQYNGDDPDTHFNALQITVAKQLTKGLTFNANYAWQRSINFGSGYSTWIKRAQKGRDDSQREQQLVPMALTSCPSDGIAVRLERSRVSWMRSSAAGRSARW